MCRAREPPLHIVSAPISYLVSFPARRAKTLVPGMSLYEFSQVSDAESQAVGDEDPMIFDS